jgi:putative transposase
VALALDNSLNMLYISSMETTKSSSKLDYQRDEHRVHLIVYHLIWCPKRRKPLLVGAVKERCQTLIEAKCKEKGWTILTLAIQPDHIYLFVRVWPSDSAAAVAKELKGTTSFYLRKEFRELTSKLPSLWTRSYFASTAGNVSKETIQRYLDGQKGI